MGEPGGLPSMGSHRVGHDWSDLAAAAASSLSDKTYNFPWYSSTWTPYFNTITFSPLLLHDIVHSHGVAKSQTRLSDFTFSFHFSLSRIGEGNGNPLQCSCLENPRDPGAWWAAVYGVAQSRTRLKRLSSSSSIVHFAFYLHSSVFLHLSRFFTKVVSLERVFMLILNIPQKDIIFFW